MPTGVIEVKSWQELKWLYAKLYLPKLCLNMFGLEQEFDYYQGDPLESPEFNFHFL